jgi:hypothetical protein
MLSTGKYSTYSLTVPTTMDELLYMDFWNTNKIETEIVIQFF